MSDEPKVPEAPKAPEAPAETPEQKGILRDLQAERSKRQALQKQLDDIKLASTEAEEKRLKENEEFKTLYETEKAKVAEYEPLVNDYKARDEARKAVLLEKLGEDADDFKELGISALEKVVNKITNLNPPPQEPGKPGMSPKGEFGGYETMLDLSKAVAKGVPGAREKYAELKARG